MISWSGKEEEKWEVYVFASTLLTYDLDDDETMVLMEKKMEFPWQDQFRQEMTNAKEKRRRN